MLGLDAVGTNASSSLISNEAVLTGADELFLAQMRPNEGLGFVRDLGDALTGAVDQAINNLPSGLQGAANLLRNTPSDVIAAGAVLNLPGNRKMGLFLLQPTLPTNALLPDLSKPPIIFFSVPSMGLVGTYNPANNQVEFGGGAVSPVAAVPNTVFFYNVRAGGRETPEGGVTSTSGNFGFLNSTVSDPIAKWVIDQGSKGVTYIARALQAAGLLGDVVSVPSGEGVIGAVTVEAARLVLIDQLQRQTKFFVGPGWRGADFEQYPNGEAILNFSGAKLRIFGGDGAGGSALPSSAFIADLPNILGSFGEINRNQLLVSTNDAIAQRLANVLYSGYLEGGQNTSDALSFTRIAYNQGGKARLAQRAIEVLNNNVPNSVTDRAFVLMGMGEQTATLAKGIYDQLRAHPTDALSPREAWTVVWNYYLLGHRGQIRTGVIDGGNAGGLNALRALAYDVGLDANQYLPSELRSFSGPEQLIASGDPNTIIGPSGTPLTPRQVLEQAAAVSLSLDLAAELSQGPAQQSEIGPILQTISQILQKFPGKVAEVGQLLANGITAYEVVQNLINGLQHEAGAITGLVTDGGRVINIPAGLQLALLGDGSQVGYQVGNVVIPLNTPEERIVEVMRGPDALRQSLSGIATLASQGVFGRDLVPVGQLGNVVLTGVTTANRIGDLSKALDLAVQGGNAAVIDMTRSQLNSEIAGAVGLGFSALGILGGDNPTIRTISNIGGSTVQVFQAVQAIQSADAALRAANASGDAVQIAAAGKALATSIVGAASVGFGVLGLFAGDNKFLQDVAKYGGAASAVALAALAPTPLAIVGAVFGILSLFGIFGGKPKTVELTNKLDVTGDGSNDKVTFRRGDWDYYYDTNAGDAGLKIENLGFKLEKLNVEVRTDDNGDEQFTNNVITSNYYSDDYNPRTSERYFLSLDVRYAALFPGITDGASTGSQLNYGQDDGGSYINGGIELNKEQYDQLMAAYGAEGVIGGTDPAVNAFKSYVNGLGNVRFVQTSAGQGMNFMLDVNADGVLDRVQQFINLEDADGPSYEGSPKFIVNFRNTTGAEYMQLSGNSLEDVAKAGALAPYILSYVASHPDLIAAFGTDVMAALPHFLVHAQERGITFDPVSYLLKYPDLIGAFGSDTVAATRHYITNGFSEGRTSTAPTTETFLQHAAVQNDPAGVLQRLAVLAPSLWQLARTDPATATPRQTAEILNSLLIVAPGAAPAILEAIAPGATYAAAAATYVAPNAPDTSAFAFLGDRIGNGQITSNQAIRSANERYVAVMQGDGNFVIYDYGVGRSTWTSNTSGIAGGRLAMQSDGNLVVYDANNAAPWVSGSGAGGVNRNFSLVMQDDGNLVVYDSRGAKALWSSQSGLIAQAEQDFLLQTGTALSETDANFEYKMFDYNRDGRDDLVAIKKSGTGTGTTEVHVYDGATNFSTALLQTGTGLHETGANFEFEVADWNRDGFMDLVAIKKSATGTASTEIHVFDGQTNFGTPLLQTGSMLQETDASFEFEVADWNGDGRQDLVAFKKSATGTGSTEVHIYDGATNFSTALLHTGTGLHETGGNFEFDLVDHNSDGRLDMVAIKKNQTGTGSTEIHVFDGALNFAAPILQTGTALHETNETFEFEISDWNRDGRADIAAIKKSGTGTGTTEVHVLNAALGGGSGQGITYDGPLIFGDRIVNRDMTANQALRSTNGRYLALMQGDGNFVVYDQAENRATWSLGTDGKAAGGRLVMQSDGNVVVYDATGQARWDAGTSGSDVNRRFTLVMQDDGNLVAYDSQGSEAVWSSMGHRDKPEPNAQFQSRDWSDLTALTYIASYGDLMNAFGADVGAGRSHFSSHGYSENRGIGFNVDAYLATRPDVRAAAIPSLSTPGVSVVPGDGESRDYVEALLGDGSRVRLYSRGTDENTGERIWSGSDNNDGWISMTQSQIDALSQPVPPSEDDIRLFGVRHYITTGRFEGVSAAA